MLPQDNKQNAPAYANSAATKAESANDLVSVIVPVYNAGDYLEPAIGSLLKQTHKNIEIICINDGSTDSSLDVMERMAKQDSRIKVIDKPNEGYGATCNLGIAKADGKWISILEPDDWIEPRMYQDMLEFASTIEGEIDIIKTPFYRVMEHEGSEVKVNCNYKGLINPPHQPFTIAEEPRFLRHHPSIWSALYRRGFIEESNIKFREYPGAGWADNPFLIETLVQAKGIVYLDNPYYCYRADSAEKEADFHRKNPEIPFDRWQEMSDGLDRLHIHDRRIREAHNARGFTYMGGVIQNLGSEDPKIQAMVKEMFFRMDPEAVMSDIEIAPSQKQFFADVVGIEGPNRKDDLLYSAYLAKRAMHNLRNTGLRETSNTVAKYLRFRRKRAGRD